MVRDRRALLALLAALTVGIAVDAMTRGRWPGFTLPVWALGGQWPGIAFPVLVALALMALTAVARAHGAAPARRNLWLLAPLAFLAAMVAVRANPLVVLLDMALSMALLALAAHFFAGGRLDGLSLPGYAGAIVRTVAAAMGRPPVLVARAIDVGGLRRGRGRTPLGVVRGVVIAVPVLVVFAAMLSSADLVFARRARDVLDVAWLAEEVVEWVWRASIVLCAAWLVAGSLAHAVRHRPVADEDESGGPGCEARRDRASLVPGFVGATETVTVLSLVAALFGTFVWIQLAYLFGGEANIRAEGFTYADYARRGFFELIAVALLSLGLLLALREVTDLRGRAPRLLFNCLASAIIALVLAMLVSAFERLRLYEAAYGFTLLRVISHVFIVWLGGLLAWTVAVLWRWRERFAVGALLAGLGFAVTVNVLNPDAFVAERNLARYERALSEARFAPAAGEAEATVGAERRGGYPALSTTGTGRYDVEGLGIDTRYLGRLSTDATPVLARARDHALDTRVVDAASAALADQCFVAEQRAGVDSVWYRVNLSWSRAQALLCRAP